MHAEMTPLKLIVKKNSHVRVNTMSGSNSTDSLKKVRGSKFSDSINSSGSHLLTR